jgi:threonine/homoserine/homoserine lactone efflux protein
MNLAAVVFGAVLVLICLWWTFGYVWRRARRGRLHRQWEDERRRRWEEERERR